MADVKVDIVDGATLEYTDQGYTTTRVATVNDITGGTPSARMYNALQQSGLPNYGEAHPSISGIRVVGISATPDGAHAVRITYRYAAPQTSGGGGQVGDQPVIEVGATLMEVETQREYDGTVMRLQPHNPENAGELDGPEVVVTGRKLVPRPFIRYQRKVDTAPDNRAKNYVGKVNSTNFAGFGFNEWLCSEIVGRSVDGGQTWTENLEFLLADQDNRAPGPGDVNAGWDLVAIATKDGIKQLNPVDGVSIDRFALYDAIDFGGLGL